MSRNPQAKGKLSLKEGSSLHAFQKVMKFIGR